MTGKLYIGNLPESANSAELETKFGYDDVVISVSRIRLKQSA